MFWDQALLCSGTTVKYEFSSLFTQGVKPTTLISTTANYKRNQGKSFGGFNLLLKDPHMVIRVDFPDQLL